MPKQDKKSDLRVEDGDKPVKIRAYDEDGGGDTFWARPLGNMLYEVQNIVMYAPGLHPEDIVRCFESDDDLPAVVEVVRRSQVRTLVVIFSEQATVDQIVDVLWEIAQLGAPFEKASDRVVGLGVPAGSDFNAVVNVLEREKGHIVDEYEEL
jgi:hypothetical protein